MTRVYSARVEAAALLSEISDWAFDFQSMVYESLAHLGPECSALCAGFAVFHRGELHLTKTGERYLDTRPQ